MTRTERENSHIPRCAHDGVELCREEALQNSFAASRVPCGTGHARQASRQLHSASVLTAGLVAGRHGIRERVKVLEVLVEEPLERLRLVAQEGAVRKDVAALERERLGLWSQ